MSVRLVGIKTDPELLALLKKAASRKLTPAEIRAQKISWVFGQCMSCAPHITKEEIARRIDERG